MSDKKKFERITTPAGIANYPWLNKPDTQWNPDGEYKVNVVFDAKDVKGICKKIDEVQDDFYKETVANAKTPALKKAISKEMYAYVPEVNDEGEETGRIILKAKQKALIRTKDGKEFSKTVPLFDAKGKKTDVRIGGGSKIKMSIELVPYFGQKEKKVGVTLRLLAVQIIDLVEHGTGDAGAYGFGEEEGFEASDEKAIADSFDDEKPLPDDDNLY